MAVNVSARQLFHATFHDEVAEALRQTGVPACDLELEITESALAMDFARALDVVNRIKKLGVHFAIDDFGTGTSTLARMKHFPVDSLKIDRSFIGDLPHDRSDSAIVSAIVSMAHDLGLSVVAEGVETAEQASIVRELGCDEQQGHYYARPMPAEQIELYLRRSRNLEPQQKIC